MNIRPEVLPFIYASLAAGFFVFLLLLACRLRRRIAAWTGTVIAIILCGYMVYFFRDPDRTPPSDPHAVLAGADGVVMHVTDLFEPDVLATNAVRISIYLSLFDVHVNRAPISGMASFLAYVPGKHYLTIREKSSELNQHNKILIEGNGTRCLIHQIVGPVCRRVVYWPDHDKPTPLKAGDRIGMMKFGSRLDMIFPKHDIEVLVAKGDRVSAGETVIARLKRETLP